MATTPYLGRLTWGGSVYSEVSGGAAVEIWSNMLSLFVTADGFDDITMLTGIHPGLTTWFSSGLTAIHKTVALEWVKFGVVDPDTGLEISDPVPLYMPIGTPPRGGTNTNPPPALTTSSRITIDDATRNRRARGGFFIPRWTGAIQRDGRFTSGDLGNLQASTATWFADLASLHALPGVYSQAGHVFTLAQRFRIGDVPDNIRRRKNDLIENYISQAI